MRKASAFWGILVVVLLGIAGGSYAIFAGDEGGADGEAVVSEFQGFGAKTTGGQGGRVVTVTTLDDAGEGSLRWAIEDFDEKRVIEFDVAGVIQLEGQIEVGQDVSILGRTAPGEIVITGSRLQVVGGNVIIQGLRIRPGDGPGGSFESRDAISIGKDGTPIKNVVIDGNSLTWAADENLSLWGDVTDVTISNNIIAHGLDESTHPKGPHSMGLLIGGGGVERVTVIGNLLAHNQNRNPAIKDDSRSIELINNVIYNWGNNGLNVNGSTVNVLGNVFIPGPDSAKRAPISLRADDAGNAAHYLHDNIADVRGADTTAEASAFEQSGAPVKPAAEALDWVLAAVGARSPELDQVDAAIIEDVADRKGRIINSPSELEGWNDFGFASH